MSHSAQTVTTVNNYNDNDDYSNSDSTATTTEANNNDNTITNNGPASMVVVVLRLARSESGSCSRKRGRSPTAAAAAASSSRSGDGDGDEGEGEGRRGGILKRPKKDREAPTLEPYVPAPLPEIKVNVDDARIPIEFDSDLTDDEKVAKYQRGRAIRQARRPNSLRRRRRSGPHFMSCSRTSGGAST